MPATSPEAKLRKSRRRNAKLALDPQARLERNVKREANRSARLAADPPAAKKRDRMHLDCAKVRRAKVQQARPFVGCDGEGARQPDATGAIRSFYNLFRMGERELFRDNARLTTRELLTFILDHPDASDILVGFFFEYDISNILYDVSRDRDPAKPSIPSPLELILRIDLKAKDRLADPYKFPHWVKLDYPGEQPIGVEYLPRNHFKVCRLQWTRPKLKGGKFGRLGWHAIPGSTRAIYDTQGFFQCGFLDALKLWGVGAEHWETIEAMKDDRSKFTTADANVRRYNAIECDLLADMMEQFRLQCVATGMVPRTWNGAGKIASAIMRQHGVMVRKRLLEITPSDVLDHADAAYYGGRFETTRAGSIASRSSGMTSTRPIPPPCPRSPVSNMGNGSRRPATSWRTSATTFSMSPASGSSILATSSFAGSPCDRSKVACHGPVRATAFIGRPKSGRRNGSARRSISRAATGSMKANAAARASTLFQTSTQSGWRSARRFAAYRSSLGSTRSMARRRSGSGRGPTATRSMRG